MVLRVLIAGVAVAGAVGLAGWRQDADACHQARVALFEAGLRHQAPAATIGDLRQRCRDPEQLATAAAGVTATGHPHEGAAIARDVIRRAPRSFYGWAALTVALERDDPAGARRALARARRLNPRWRAPARP